MGQELQTRVTIDGAARPQAKVHLDSLALQISGRPRIVVPLTDVRQVAVEGARLILSTSRGEVVIVAGELAASWAEKIRKPASRAKKLGLVAGLRVALVGLDDAALRAEIRSVGAHLCALEPGADLVFLGVDDAAGLARLGAALQALVPQGALWVVRRKGRDAPVGEAEVRAAARGLGLVDVKVVAFSDTHSADKFMIPTAARPRQAARKPGGPRTKARA